MSKSSFYQSSTALTELPAQTVVTPDTTNNAPSSFYKDGPSYDEVALGRLSAYDLAVFVGGATLSADEVLFAHVPDASVVFSANMGESEASALTGATAATVLTIKKNGVSFGTLTYTGTTGVFVSTETSFVAGDLLTVHAPTVPDATLAGLAITLTAERS